jgi:hypothetical protein
MTGLNIGQSGGLPRRIAMTVLKDTEDKKRVEAALGKVREKLADLNLEIEELKGIIDGVPFGGNDPRNPKK